MTIGTIGGLPLELDDLIRSFLSAKDLCVSSKVNKAWHSLSTQERHWKNLLARDFPDFHSTITNAYLEGYRLQKRYKITPYPLSLIQALGEETFDKIPYVKLDDFSLFPLISHPLSKGYCKKERTYFIILRLRCKSTYEEQPMLIYASFKWIRGGSIWIRNPSEPWRVQEKNSNFCASLFGRKFIRFSDPFIQTVFRQLKDNSHQNFELAEDGST